MLPSYSGTSKDGGKVHPTTDDEADFDLHQNYRNAVDCLIHCEHIIKNLQDQLASKDERIAALEGRLVTMSLELADSKALEDEHQLLKRRLSSVSIASNGSGGAHGTHQQTNKTNQSVSARNLRSRNSRARHIPAINQSWTEYGDGYQCQLPTKEILQAQGASEVKQGRWPDVSLDTNMNDSSKDNSSSRSGVASASTHGSVGRSSPIISTMYNRRCGMGNKKGSAPSLNKLSPTTVRPNLRNRRGSWAEESFTTRQLNNISQILLGRNKCDEGEDHVAPERIRQRRDSISSCRSGISGVVFPVSSADCLVGLGVAPLPRGDTPHGMNGHSNSAFEEWPTFR